VDAQRTLVRFDQLAKGVVAWSWCLLGLGDRPDHRGQVYLARTKPAEAMSSGRGRRLYRCEVIGMSKYMVLLYANESGMPKPGTPEFDTQNAAYGDELNSTTPSAAGGVTICTGADNYKFNHNWICGNLSTGDGGGFTHMGFSANGNISNNQILFNQSSNPTIPTHGGGVTIMGDLPDGVVCEALTIDTDCAPTLGNGIGGNLTIDANLILGNTAESQKADAEFQRLRQKPSEHLAQPIFTPDEVTKQKIESNPAQ